VKRLSLLFVASHDARELQIFYDSSVRRVSLFAIGLMAVMAAAILLHGQAGAAQLQLRWQDGSSDEDGFQIERKSGRGKFKLLATTGPDVTFYLDTNLKSVTIYCYRVRAYNSAGNSQYSNPACGKTQADLSISKTGSGTGTVLSIPPGIDCGAACTASYAVGSIVGLVAIPDAGSVLKGWRGKKDCRDGTVTMNTNRSCTAVFVIDPAAPLPVATVASINKPTVLDNATRAGRSGADGQAVPPSNGWPSFIGVFRPSTGEWFLDKNGTGSLDSCRMDTCVGSLGKEGDIPVTGSWMGTQAPFLGVFDPGSATWYLDLDGNGVLDGCEANACRYIYGEPGDLPVVGDWTGEGRTKIGVFRPATGEWHFDIKGAGDLAGCNLDSCSRFFGGSGDLPVVGDWTGEGKTKIGVFRLGTGEWLLDFSGAGDGKSCAGQCLSFGAEGDLPVVGDWDGAGADKIGVFRPGTGQWFLDLNGNGQWDGCSVDLCRGPFGQPGDLPVVGKWM
jgi:hypothetical protein